MVEDQHISWFISLATAIEPITNGKSPPSFDDLVYRTCKTYKTKRL